MERLIYAMDNGVWSCAYLGMTGHGQTPSDAHANLLVLVRAMCAPWKSCPIQ